VFLLWCLGFRFLGTTNKQNYMIISLIAFILVLGILVMVHELGHFGAAKFFKVKVLEFSLGFPPRITSFKRGETKYTIGAIPFGGYVSMLGENEESKDPRAYNNQSAGKRFVIGIAGVVMNLILAWVLLTVGFIVGMTPMATPSDQVPGTKVSPQVFVVEVQPNSPAEKGGLKAGDQLISGNFDGQSVKFDSAADVSNFTASHIGESVEVKVKRTGEEISNTILLSGENEAPLGIGIFDQAVVKVPWYKAPYVALRETGQILKITFSFLGNVFERLFSTGELSDHVGGPIAIFTLSGQAARAGAMTLLQFISALSINLALLNILPFPALDGGRGLFIILEKLFGKRVVKESVENAIHMVGFVLLIVFALAITYKDIVRLLK